jgi:hypothetical protein
MGMTVVAMGEPAMSPCCNRANALQMIVHGHSMQFPLFNTVFEFPRSSLLGYINRNQKVRQILLTNTQSINAKSITLTGA